MNRSTLHRLIAPCLSLALLAAAAPLHASVVAAAYGDSMELLRAGRFDEARAAFEALLTRHPDTAYSDNARYWIGETYYAQRDYASAMAAFHQVVVRHADEPKAPDALFKIALCNRELGHDEGYRNALISLRSRYPEAEVSARAEGILVKMEGIEPAPSTEPVITAAPLVTPTITPPPTVLDSGVRTKGVTVEDESRVEDDGMIATLPASPSREELRSIRRHLDEEREALERRAEEEMTPGEVLLAVVAPGGLLYIAHHQQQKLQATEELKTIDQDYALLAGEEAELPPEMFAGITVR